MSTYNMLELTLNEILRIINPSWEDRERRVHVIDEFRAVVNTVESLRGATVEPFGSFLSNLFTRWGDLDISIELSNGSYISSVGKKQKQTLLRDVLKALRKRGGLRSLQFVHNARVPILKFESNFYNISCDISINNLCGQMKSKFLSWISRIDARFRDMVLLVKEWAKAQDINNSKTGTFNSYSLCLLVVFHFQTCIPAILPPLKDLYPGNIAGELTGVRASVERRIEEVCAANISKFIKQRTVNQSSLTELFISFLLKFSDIDKRAADQGICPYMGQWEDISSNMRWLPKTYAVFIEDPFEQPENTARAVSKGQLTRISEVFKTTFHGLITPNLNRNSLISTLLRPQISQSLLGDSARNSNSYVGSYPKTNANVHRSVHLPSQVQPQFFQPKTPTSSHNNVAMASWMSGQVSEEQSIRRVIPMQPPRQSPMTASTSQPKKESWPRVVPATQGQGRGQQLWRPKYYEASDR
ncbi:hypothetical protein Nepgr_020908 [Nepenthes gracilis]|uniref:Poly(A) RNA polymerase mitochondrial-like central palm domain-containing protein n=1 Tax=Nepenthes gracilis TaxID=150966 RepID=A0AAD3SYU3_NEPGR|nr:hypothetical protein Nepgr_020908 [Nepenthes gracilis]